MFLTSKGMHDRTFELSAQSEEFVVSACASGSAEQGYTVGCIEQTSENLNVGGWRNNNRWRRQKIERNTISSGRSLKSDIARNNKH